MDSEVVDRSVIVFDLTNRRNKIITKPFILPDFHRRSFWSVTNISNWTTRSMLNLDHAAFVFIYIVRFHFASDFSRDRVRKKTIIELTLNNFNSRHRNEKNSMKKNDDFFQPLVWHIVFFCPPFFRVGRIWTRCSKACLDSRLLNGGKSALNIFTFRSFSHKFHKLFGYLAISIKCHSETMWLMPHWNQWFFSIFFFTGIVPKHKTSHCKGIFRGMHNINICIKIFKIVGNEQRNLNDMRNAAGIHSKIREFVWILNATENSFCF